MSITRSRRLGVIAAAGVGILGSAAVVASVAQAGHENAVLEAELTGAAEVAADGSDGPAGDPAGSGEAYVFGIDDDPITLCYVLTATGIDLTFETGMAHIHRGAEGENGPVVAALAFPLNGDAGDCLTEGEEGKFPLIGEEGEPESIVADILANPADYYVNVHTAEFPDGAIRGQLSNVQDRPTSSEPTTDAEPAGSEPMSSEPMGSEPMGSEPMGSEPMGSEPMGSEPMGSEPMGSEPMGSEPMGSEPMGSTPATSTP